MSFPDTRDMHVTKSVITKNDNLSLQYSTNWPPQRGRPARELLAAQESNLCSLNEEKWVFLLYSGNTVHAEILENQDRDR